MSDDEYPDIPSRGAQLVIEAPPWLENKPEIYEAEVKKQAQEISTEDAREELSLIANGLPTLLTAKELYNALYVLRDSMVDFFGYLGGGRSLDLREGKDDGYCLEYSKSAWNTVRKHGHRAIAWYSLVLNNKDAENYFKLVDVARKVYLSWGLFDVLFSDDEEMQPVFLKLKHLHTQLIKLHQYEPHDGIGNLDRHKFVG